MNLLYVMRCCLVVSTARGKEPRTRRRKHIEQIEEWEIALPRCLGIWEALCATSAFSSKWLNELMLYDYTMVN